MEKLNRPLQVEVLSEKRAESQLFRPESKVGHIANGYTLHFFDNDEIWLTDEQAQKLVLMLEDHQFVSINGGIYKTSGIKKIVPHERKLTDDELYQNALNFKLPNHDKFRSL